MSQLKVIRIWFTHVFSLRYEELIVRYITMLVDCRHPLVALKDVPVSKYVHGFIRDYSMVPRVRCLRL